MYIKLDKKLILEANNIKIKTSSDSAISNIDQFKRHIMSVPIVLKYFQRIDIQNLKIDNNNLYIKFDSNVFYFNSDHIYIEATPGFFANQVKLDVKQALVKQHNITFDGQIIADFNKNKLFYIGDMSYKNQKLKLNIQSDKKIAEIYITSDNLSDISVVKDFIRLDPSIEKWLYTSVKGTHNLDFLSLAYDIDNAKIINNSIKLNTNIKDSLVYFKDKLQPVKSSNVNIKYNNSKLEFEFTNPIYKTTPLNGSSLYIDNIDTDKKSTLYLNLKSKSKLNSDINEILKAYEINLPLRQDSGSLDTNMGIKIDLSNDNVEVGGIFKIDNSQMQLGKLKFYTKNCLVVLQNNIIDIKANEVSLLDKKLNINIDDLKLNTKTSTAVGEFFINRFSIDDELIDIIDVKSALYIDFKSNPVINIPIFGTIIEANEGFTSIEIDDISKYTPYSKLISDSGIEQGSISLEVKNNDSIDFIANITKLNSPLVIDSIKLIGNTTNDKSTIFSNDKKIRIDQDSNTTNIFIDGIDIDRSKIIPKLDENYSSILNLEAINSNILLDTNKKLLANRFLYTSRPNGDINFDLSYDNTKVSFSTINNSSTINIIDANKSFINSFMGNDDFISSGNVNIHGVSNKSNRYLYSGELSLKDTNFKDFKALNNILTMLQSSSAVANPLLALPTLFRVVKGDIKLNGYKAIDGTIKYAYNHQDKFLNLHDIKTYGAEIDFDGSAIIDLDKKTINSKLKVIFMKDIINIGSKIPIVNLVINKKNRIYSTITINGNLKDPETKFILFNSQ